MGQLLTHRVPSIVLEISPSLQGTTPTTENPLSSGTFCRTTTYGSDNPITSVSGRYVKLRHPHILCHLGPLSQLMRSPLSSPTLALPRSRGNPATATAPAVRAQESPAHAWQAGAPGPAAVRAHGIASTAWAGPGPGLPTPTPSPPPGRQAGGRRQGPAGWRRQAGRAGRRLARGDGPSRAWSRSHLPHAAFTQKNLLAAPPPPPPPPPRPSPLPTRRQSAAGRPLRPGRRRLAPEWHHPAIRTSPSCQSDGAA